MKVHLLLFSLLVFVSVLVSGKIQAQEVKKVTERPDRGFYKEEFYVLKSDKNIKHGPYSKISNSNKIIETGFYKNNLKDSTWTEYHTNSEAPASKGNYSENKKTGVWEYLMKNGNAFQKFDYSENKLIYISLTEEEKNRAYEVKTANGIEKMKLDQPPVFIGGTTELWKSMGKQSLRYPPQALRNRVTGTVLISFFIDEKGNPGDFKIEKGIGSGCDEEALRIASSGTAKWLPGLVNGKPVTAKVLHPVNFGMQ